jgi:hypothetical protein
MKSSSVYQKLLVKKGWHNHLVFTIDLPSKPLFFRSYKYTWESTEKLQISGPLSPKILKLSDNSYLMANKYFGTWVYDPKNPLILEWEIVSKNVQPFFKYDDYHGRIWLEVGSEFKEEIELSIYETKDPVEISFSKLSFKPVVIFTDHCDFDSDTLLRKQRFFLKKVGLKITKGFFLKKYSHKGDWNSAYEGNEEEFNHWMEDGHELCYHSLSQSILPEGGNERIYNNFKSPLNKQIETWIDHGYQTYNISKSRDNGDRKKRIFHLSQKGIKYFWNYFDVGEVIDNMNQLDFQQLQIHRVLTSCLSFKDKMRILYYYNSSESQVVIYRNFASAVKQKMFLKMLKSTNTFMVGLWKLCKAINKEELVKRAQCVFSSENPSITAFQTIVVKDWVNTLGKPYERLKDESGLSILHTYFSFLGKHHGNTLFQNENGEINEDVKSVFSRLKVDIDNGEVWNPTLNEFISYIQFLTEGDVDELISKYNHRYIC